MKNSSYILYIIVLCMILLVPFAGMTFWPTNESSENTPMVAVPSLTENGHLNTDILSHWGSWFENHYAFRQYLITANSWLYTTLLKTSPVEKVILGKDDWLFYQETLSDYTGTDLLSEREIYNIVHNIKLMQWSAESQGASFLVTVCPNKNTVYPEKMDDKYPQGIETNLQLFTQAMKDNQIPYADLSDALINHKEEMLYYHRDSHWNQVGALLGYNQLMTSLGLSSKNYMETGTSVHKSDLDEMLLPKAWEGEEEKDYTDNFHYDSTSDDYMDDFIHTVNEQGEGTLLMFRDSFGTNIIPYLADTYEQAYFSRFVPYNFVQLQDLKPDTVIVERVERRIRSFEETAAIMIMPAVAAIQATDTGKQIEISTEEQGSFLLFQGPAPAEGTEDDFYLEVSDSESTVKMTVPVFYTVDEERNNQFAVYLLKSLIEENDIIKLVKITKNESVSYTLIERKGEEK